jgi:L-aminopeptidase/D-esterase-like protein
VDVRGGAPGTRETDLLDPRQTVSVVHGVLLSGGSAFGLAAADGVVRYLEQKGVGLAVGRVRVPIVPAAILFDLGIGDPAIRPDAESGYQACRAARGLDARPGAATSPRGRDLEQGNVGAGAGATVGKLLGMERAMKGGTGTASIRLPDGLVVGALVAVNALGDVVDPATGRLLAGARSADGKSLADAMELLRQGKLPGPGEGQRLRNTTIGVVATNAALTKSEAGKVAQMAHDGLARSIRPCHMPFDGDTLFALSTGKRPYVPGSHGMVGALAADAVAAAVVSAVMHARGIPGFPASSDLRR